MAARKTKKPNSWKLIVLLLVLLLICVAAFAVQMYLYFTGKKKEDLPPPVQTMVTIGTIMALPTAMGVVGALLVATGWGAPLGFTILILGGIVGAFGLYAYYNQPQVEGLDPTMGNPNE